MMTHLKKALSTLIRTQAVVHANVSLIKKTSDGSKILAMVLQSYFKHGGQNTQQQRFERKGLAMERTGILDDIIV